MGNTAKIRHRRRRRRAEPVVRPRVTGTVCGWCYKPLVGAERWCTTCHPESGARP